MKNAIRRLALSVTLVLLALAPTHGATESKAATAPAGTLPLSEIVLYTSGVGYFQRDGAMEGRGEIELRFRADQVNDLLKSMVVQDFDGGQVGIMTYDSRDPITKTLKSFAIDLTTSVGLGQLLERIRGEQIEVGGPTPLRGVIVGVEKKRERAGEKELDVEYLNLLTESGLRTVPLPGIQRIQLSNARLDSELRQALQVLASAHDSQKKTVRLNFEGQGQRRVRVGYVMETPVWKTTYRLALADGKPPFLQGWAIVENTTDDDWEQVKLSLISGRPISFTMDLYEPLYVKRPTLTLERYESLRPQAYEQAREAEARSRLEALADAGMMTKSGRAAPSAAPPPALRRDLSLEGGGVAAAAEGREAGELYEYAIGTPVSLARHKSAMLPIVNVPVEGEKLSIYNERVHPKHPLNGVRLKNSTGQHLLQGPITVFDGGVYAGDAQLGNVTAGQERLLSYALDLRMEVEPERPAEQELLVSAALRKGTLLVSRKHVSEKTYIVTNRDKKPKTALIEHPVRADWTLIQPAKPERTRDMYRFAVTAKAGESARLRVREERPLQQTIALTDAGPNIIALYVQAREVSPKVKEALGRVVALRSRVDRTAAKRADVEKRVDEITREQARIRDNMGRVPANSELHARYLTKLGQQETEIESLRKELASLRSEERSQKQEMEEYLLKLDVE